MARCEKFIPAEAFQHFEDVFLLDLIERRDLIRLLVRNMRSIVGDANDAKRNAGLVFILDSHSPERAE